MKIICTHISGFAKGADINFIKAINIMTILILTMTGNLYHRSLKKINIIIL